MTDFDGLRCAVVPGAGVLARFDGIVCFVPPTQQPLTELINGLLALCRDTAGEAPGRTLARRAAGWLANLGPEADGLAFGLVSSTGDDGLAVFLLGGARARIPDQGLELSGSDAAAWTDRLIARPDSAVVLTATSDIDVGATLEGPFNLRSGTVPAAGAVLCAASLKADRRSTGSPVAAQRTVKPSDGLRPVPSPDAAVGQRLDQGQARSFDEDSPDPGPNRSDLLIDAPEERSRPPLPGGEPGPASSNVDTDSEADSDPGSPMEHGFLCANGHLNDPRSHFCLLCGIRMNERTGNLVAGRRPPLGLLVFDSGHTYTVDADYLLGRMPEVDDRVRSGAIRAITLAVADSLMSRVHAEIRLQGWDVTVGDSGSSNGTYVQPPGQDEARLQPGEAHRLVPGTRVRLANTRFFFESPSGVR